MQHTQTLCEREGFQISIKIYFIRIFHSDVAGDEVDHLFVSADNDHDDRLSYDEIVDNHDIFVGSEATDYGDHLHNIERFNDEL